MVDRSYYPELFDLQGREVHYKTHGHDLTVSVHLGTFEKTARKCTWAPSSLTESPSMAAALAPCIESPTADGRSPAGGRACTSFKMHARHASARTTQRCTTKLKARWDNTAPPGHRATGAAHWTLQGVAASVRRHSGLGPSCPRPRSHRASGQLHERGNVGIGPPSQGPADHSASGVVRQPTHAASNARHESGGRGAIGPIQPVERLHASPDPGRAGERPERRSRGARAFFLGPLVAVTVCAMKLDAMCYGPEESAEIDAHRCVTLYNCVFMLGRSAPSA